MFGRSAMTEKFHVQWSESRRAWIVLLLLFGGSLVYQWIVLRILDLCLRENDLGFVSPNHGIYLFVSVSSMMVLPLILTFWSSLGFRRLTAQVPVALLLNSLAFWARSDVWREPAIVSPPLLFVLLLLPWLGARCWLRWRLTVPSTSPADRVCRENPRQFSLAELLTAMLTIGIALGLSKLHFARGHVEPTDFAIALPVAGVVTLLLMPGCCFFWGILADGRARWMDVARSPLIAIILTGAFLSWMGFAGRSDMIVLVLICSILFYLTLWVGLSLVLVPLRLIGIRLVR